MPTPDTESRMQEAGFSWGVQTAVEILVKVVHSEPGKIIFLVEFTIVGDPSWRIHIFFGISICVL